MKKILLVIGLIFIANSLSYGQVCRLAEKMSGTSQDYAYKVVADEIGNVYVAGYFNSDTMRFNNGKSLANLGTADAYIAKYNSSGVCLWAERLAGSNSDALYSIALDSVGNVYVGGYFYSDTLFLNNGKYLLNEGETDGFFAKYNSSGVCQWAQKIAGYFDEYVYSLAIDIGGNIFVSGYFTSNPLNFNNGKTLASTAGVEGYIAKYNSSGICQWVEKISGNGTDYANKLVIDANSNIYIAGHFYSDSIAFNNSKMLTGSSNYDAYIAKYDAAGLCLWAQKIAGTKEDYTESIEVDTGGNVYVGGHFRSYTLSFNNGKSLNNVSGGSEDGYIAKYNSAGLCQWAQRLAGNSDDWVRSIALDRSGNVYATGYFVSATFNLNNGFTFENNSGSYDIYIAKYNPSGLCLWAEKIYGTGSDFVYSIFVDASDNVYIGGYYYSSILNFNNDITLTVTSYPDAFFSKYNPKLNLLSPVNNSIDIPVSTSLVWNSLPGATKYQLQLSTSNAFTDVKLDTTLNILEKSVTGLLGNTVYYWRTRSVGATDTSAWSSVWSFTTVQNVVAQIIPLDAGWNMISANVVPQNLEMSSILQANSGNIRLVKNATGQIYAPPFQNSLSSWNIAEAYQILMNSADTLVLSGTPIDPTTKSIILNRTGWYWLPYYRTSSLSPASALTSISGKYLQIKNIQGQFYQPASGIPGQFYPIVPSTQLQILEPNKGYMIRITSSDGVLIYPEN